MNIFDKARLISLANSRNMSTIFNNIVKQRDSNLQNLKSTSSVNKTEACIETLGEPVVAQGFDRLFELMSTFNYTVESTDTEVADFVNQQLLDSNFEVLFEGLGLAKLSGLAALEVIWGYQSGKTVVEDLLPVDSSRIVYQLNNENDYRYVAKFTTKSQPFTGEPLPYNKVIIHKYYSAYIDSPYGLGIGGLLVELIQIKNTALDLWLKIANKHSMPTIVANVGNSSPEDEVEEFFEGLKSMLNSSVFVMPEDYKLDIVNTSATGLESILIPLIAYCDEQINGLILGESITGKELANGSMSRDVVAKDITSLKALSLAKGVANTLNKTIVKWLVAYNFPESSAVIKVSSPDNSNDNINLYKELKAIGVNIPADWLANKFGVPHEERQKLGDNI